jgi:hypothetical protein
MALLDRVLHEAGRADHGRAGNVPTTRVGAARDAAKGTALRHAHSRLSPLVDQFGAHVQTQN